MTAHWGIKDPSRVEGNDIERERAFVQALRYLETRLSLFMALPLETLEAKSLVTKLRAIGQSEGASNPRPEVA